MLLAKLLCSVILLYVVETQNFERLQCEPVFKKHNDLNFWSKKYDFVDLEAGWHSVFIHRSKYTASNIERLGRSDKEINNTVPHVHFTGITLYRTGTKVPLGKYNVGVLLNFYHGDNMIVHLFDDKTRKYQMVELGFHTRKYFLAVKPNTWYTFDFLQHTKESFVFMGFTVVRGSSMLIVRNVAEENHMIKMFPEQAELVHRLIKKD